MSSVSRIHSHARKSHEKKAPPDTAEAAKTEARAQATRRMRRGKLLVMSGFVVAIAGIIGYSVACLSAGVNQQLGLTLLASPGWLLGPTLGIIGLGTLLWLVGSFMYLSAALDSDPDEVDPDL